MRSPLFAMLLSVAACGGASAPAAERVGTTSGATTGDPACPMDVPGTSVSVEDTARGAALVFVTTGDVAELRARVGRVVEAHNTRHAAMGPLPSEEDVPSDDGGHHHHHGGGGEHASHDGGEHAGHGGGDGLAGMISNHARARLEEIEGGARLVFVSMAGSEQALRDELRMHAGHLAAGSCGMGHP